MPPSGLKCIFQYSLPSRKNFNMRNNKFTDTQTLQDTFKSGYLCRLCLIFGPGQAPLKSKLHGLVWSLNFHISRFSFDRVTWRKGRTQHLNLTRTPQLGVLWYSLTPVPPPLSLEVWTEVGRELDSHLISHQYPPPQKKIRPPHLSFLLHTTWVPLIPPA